MQSLVEFIAKTFAESPEEVEVTESDDRRIELVVADEDLGRIIGRRGKTAKAMRTVLAAACADGAACELDISSRGEEEAE